MTYLKKFGCKTTIALQESRYWRTTQKEIPWEKVKKTIRINTSKMHFLFVFVLNAPFKSFSCFFCVKQEVESKKNKSLDCRFKAWIDIELL